MPSAADRREVGAVYGAGLAQGVALVAIAAGVIAFVLVPRSPHAIAGVAAGAPRS